MSYQQFRTDIKESADQMDQRQAVKSQRNGGARFRDWFVFGKMSFAEAQQYLAPFLAIITVMALVPMAVININSFLELVGVGITIPVWLGSAFGFIAFVCIGLFGVLALKYFGTLKRQIEIAGQMNPAQFTLYKKLTDIEERLKDLEANHEG